MRVHLACYHQLPFRAGLDKAAVATTLTRASVDGAEEQRLLIRPDNHPTAVATHRAAGVHRRAVLNPHCARVLNVRVLTQLVAADTHRAAAGRARRVDLRVGGQPHCAAEYVNRTAGLAGILAGDVEGAGDGDVAGIPL